MSMARFVSQALNRYQRSTSILVHHRAMSAKPIPTQFAESDSEPSSPSSSSSSSESGIDDSISKAMKKLDEAMQNFMILRAAPDWLPFVPGASYWVPPPTRNHSCAGLIEILDRLPKSRRSGARNRSASIEFLSEDSLGSARVSPLPLTMEVVMLDSSDNVATDSDEED